MMGAERDWDIMCGPVIRGYKLGQKTDLAQTQKHPCQDIRGLDGVCGSESTIFTSKLKFCTSNFALHGLLYLFKEYLKLF